MSNPERLYPPGLKHGERHRDGGDPIPTLTELLEEVVNQFLWQEGEDPAYKDANIHRMLYAVKYAVDYWGNEICKRLDTLIAK